RRTCSAFEVYFNSSVLSPLTFSIAFRSPSTASFGRSYFRRAIGTLNIALDSRTTIRSPVSTLSDDTSVFPSTTGCCLADLLTDAYTDLKELSCLNTDRA
ncbi:hypothetical protein PMAYCL1PPCAC_21901, partial [Pristionchus mayeri]